MRRRLKKRRRIEITAFRRQVTICSDDHDSIDAHASSPACVGGAGDSLRKRVESLIAFHEANTIETPARESRNRIPNVQASLVGQSLGSYKILSKLGAGAMGEVYHAWDSKLDRPVAVKVLTSGRASDAASL